MQDQHGDQEEADQPERADREALDAEDIRADKDLFEPAADLCRSRRPGLGLHLGDDRAETGGHHLRAEGRNEGRQMEAGDQVAVDEAERNADEDRQQNRQDQGPALLEGVAAQQCRAHHDRAEGKVDAAGDDDERHAEGHEADVVAGFENILDGVERQEVLAENREYDIKDHQCCRSQQLLHIKLFCLHFHYPTSLFVASVMIFSCVASAMSSSPVLRPSHITTTRSDIRSSSGSSEEIIMIDLPSSTS
ncbi:unknown [Firmicutes bacterium CAG:170]|nr:unknown [Firmicutes bacterium CAG:170]